MRRLLNTGHLLPSSWPRNCLSITPQPAKVAALSPSPAQGRQTHPAEPGTLSKHGLGFVFLDGYYMPPIGKVFEAHGAATADFTVIRLHGADRKEI